MIVVITPYNIVTEALVALKRMDINDTVAGLVCTDMHLYEETEREYIINGEKFRVIERNKPDCNDQDKYLILALDNTIILKARRGEHTESLAMSLALKSIDYNTDLVKSKKEFDFKVKGIKQLSSEQKKYRNKTNRKKEKKMKLIIFGIACIIISLFNYLFLMLYPVVILYIFLFIIRLYINDKRIKKLIKISEYETSVFYIEQVNKEIDVISNYQLTIMLITGILAVINILKI